MIDPADSKVNILLVDDQPNNLLALESILAEMGQNLVRADSGQRALKQLLDREFAVILLDVQMPEMDGFETASLIRERERSRNTPIIFLTALSRSETNVFRGYELGAVDAGSGNRGGASGSDLATKSHRALSCRGLPLSSPQ